MIIMEGVRRMIQQTAAAMVIHAMFQMQPILAIMAVVLMRVIQDILGAIAIHV